MFVVITIWLHHYLWIGTGFATRVTHTVPLIEHEVIPIVRGVRVVPLIEHEVIPIVRGARVA